MTLLLGSNPNAQRLEFNVEIEAVPTGNTLNGRVRSKNDIIPQVEKLDPPFAQKKMENTKSLKDAIAGIPTLDSEKALDSEKVETTSEEATKPIRVFGDFDDIPFLGNEEPERVDDYIDKKLENSGVLVRFFDRIFNESAQNTQSTQEETE